MNAFEIDAENKRTEGKFYQKLLKEKSKCERCGHGIYECHYITLAGVEGHCVKTGCGCKDVKYEGFEEVIGEIRKRGRK